MDFFFRPYNKNFKMAKYMDFEEENGEDIGVKEKMFNLIMNSDKEIFNTVVD
jgi:hypothetical protein